jgi:SH3-like domain-containing protein
MVCRQYRLVLLALILNLIWVGSPGAEDRYIKVTGDRVNIRSEPNTKAQIVTKANRGDVFKVVSEEGDWYEISMFSGEWRYIYKPITAATTYTMEIPEDEELISTIFMALVQAENRALDQAAGKCSGDLHACSKHERLLNDQYTLNVFHEFNLQPPLYNKLIIEGVRINISK